MQVDSDCRKGRSESSTTLGLVALATILLLASSCSRPSSGEPTPTTAATSGASLSVTRTALSGATAQRATMPQATSAPATADAAPTVGSSNDAVPALSPNPPPTGIPTATYAPIERETAAAKAMANGAYEVSIALYQQMLQEGDADGLWQIALDLARAYLAVGEPREAIKVLEELTADAADPNASRALGMLAATYEQVGNWQAAVATYRQYLAQTDVLDPLIRWRIAKNLAAQDEHAQVVSELSGADLTALPAGTRAEALETLAEAQRALGNTDAALALYEAILGFAKWPSYRALLREYQAEAVLEDDRQDEAVDLLQKVLESEPDSTAAVIALTRLDEIDSSIVDDLTRGKICYSAGNAQAAVKALQRYHLSSPSADGPELQLALGNALSGVERYSEAFAAYDIVLRSYPDDALAGETWMAKARAAEAYGGDPTGIYYEFWRLLPGDSLAPNALWLAGQYAEGQNNWLMAGEYYSRLADGYPDTEHALEARFRSGLAHYARGEAEEALSAWGGDLPESTSDDERARWYVWQGLAAARFDDRTSADAAWENAVVLAPTSYYGFRARDLLAGRELVLSPEQEIPDIHRPDLALGVVRRWISSWIEQDATEEDVLGSVRAAMARETDRLGWDAETVELLAAIRDDHKDAPLAVLATMALASEMGIQSQSVACAETLLHLASEHEASTPPDALLTVAFPLDRWELVTAQSDAFSVDPLLLLAIVRQESRFNANAASYAGATGLAQVMPSTGEWIASRIGPADFHRELLYRPMVSLRYGAWYLSILLDITERDWVAALVAYNAGPGNLDRWTGGEPISDHDLFYETLPVKQAQDYVRYVYSQYAMYQSIYAD